MESINEPINNKNSALLHYKKINIFGDSKVGKSSLISLMKNYSNDNFQIESNIENYSDLSLDLNYSLVEQIKKIKITLKEEDGVYLYCSIYETNLDRYNTIKLNLDTLLLQTECIIIMFDNSRTETFDNIPNLISTIKSRIKENYFREVPIILVQNKIDLKTEDVRESFVEVNESVKKILEENKDIIYRKISLLDKNKFFELVLDIQGNINKENERFKDNVYNVKFQIYDKITETYEIVDNINNNNIIKCVLLGNSCVGKTTFFNYFHKLDEEKKENNIVPISSSGTDSLTILVEFNNKKFYVKIYDTAGQERYRSLAGQVSRDADGIFLFFDVTNKESFDEVDKFISNNREINGEDESEIILIGNKIDSEDRVISKQEAKEKAEKYNINYYECSCLNGLNIHEILNEMIVLAFNKFYEKNPNGIKKIKSFKLNMPAERNQNNNNSKNNCCQRVHKLKKNK